MIPDNILQEIEYLENQGKLQEAENLAKEVLTEARANKSGIVQQLLMILMRLSSKQRSENITFYFNELRTIVNKKSRLYASALLIMGIFYHIRFKLQKSESFLLQALEVANFLEEKDRNYIKPRILTSLGNVIAARRNKNFIAEARQYYQQAADIYRSVGEHISLASTLSNLTALALEEGDYVCAENYCLESISINTMFRNIEQIIYSQSHLANIYIHNLQVVEAAQTTIRAMELSIETQAKPETFWVLVSQGVHLANLVSLNTKALHLVEYALMYLEDDTFIADPQYKYIFTSHKAHILYSIGRYQEALELNELLLLRSKDTQMEEKDKGSLHIDTALCLIALNRLEQAKKYIEIISAEQFNSQIRASILVEKYLLLSQWSEVSGEDALPQSANQKALWYVEKALQIIQEQHIVSYEKTAYQRYQELALAYSMPLRYQQTDFPAMQLLQGIDTNIITQLFSEIIRLTALYTLRDYKKITQEYRANIQSLNLANGALQKEQEQVCNLIKQIYEESQNQPIDSSNVKKLFDFAVRHEQQNAHNNDKNYAHIALNSEKLRKKLLYKYPSISQKEMLFCLLLVQGMSRQAIASELAISEDGIKKMRYRISRKFGLPKNKRLYDHLLQIISEE